MKGKGKAWWTPEEVVKSDRDWFDMPSTEINADVKQDLEVLSMRGAFNPKKHYKVIQTLNEQKQKLWL